MTSVSYDYDSRGHGYAEMRRPDPRIAAVIHRELGDATRVLNVGAGTGSYEPTDRQVVAVEPSSTMRAQRPVGLPPAIEATAEHLPFDDASMDASMAVLTVHHWTSPAAGLQEMRRVTRGPIVVMTIDPDVFARFWAVDYAPSLALSEGGRFDLTALCNALGGRIRVVEVPIPFDCSDGFVEAYYGRPERMLEPEVRAAQSAWGFIEKPEVDAFVATLSEDLQSGDWDREYGHLRSRETYDGSIRLVVSDPL